MRLLNRQINANSAAFIWKQQYGNGDYGADKLVILNKLHDLGENPDPDDVDKVIGNKSWTRTECSECGSDAPVVELGQEPDYESYTAYICEDCLRKALKLIKQTSHKAA